MPIDVKCYARDRASPRTSAVSGLDTEGLLDNQCAGHVRVTFASADIEIGSRWRSHGDSNGFPWSNHNAGGTGRFRSLLRQRGLGCIHEDRAVELVHFPAGVVDGEGEG